MKNLIILMIILINQ